MYLKMKISENDFRLYINKGVICSHQFKYVKYHKMKFHPF